jgi:hypothetical protein
MSSRCELTVTSCCCILSVVTSSAYLEHPVPEGGGGPTCVSHVLSPVNVAPVTGDNLIHDTENSSDVSDLTTVTCNPTSKLTSEDLKPHFNVSQVNVTTVLKITVPQFRNVRLPCDISVWSYKDSEVRSSSSHTFTSHHDGLLTRVKATYNCRPLDFFTTAIFLFLVLLCTVLPKDQHIFRDVPLSYQRGKTKVPVETIKKCFHMTKMTTIVHLNRSN